MPEWEAEAACLGFLPVAFFEAIWPDGSRSEFPDGSALAQARSVCRRCPVRGACFVDCMTAEAGEAAKNRHGLFAALTPLQRASLEKRGQGVPEAPCCTNRVWDPIEHLTGEMHCLSCHTVTQVPPLPDGGDAWTPRHSRLAEDVVRWIVDNTELGQQLPQPSTLAREFGRRKADMQRVYDALVQDGTLARVSGGAGHDRFVREGQLSVTKRWYAPHLTA